MDAGLCFSGAAHPRSKKCRTGNGIDHHDDDASGRCIGTAKSNDRGAPPLEDETQRASEMLGGAAVNQMSSASPRPAAPPRLARCPPSPQWPPRCVAPPGAIPAPPYIQTDLQPRVPQAQRCGHRPGRAGAFKARKARTASMLMHARPAIPHHDRSCG